MRVLIQSGEAAFSLGDFEDEIRKDIRKANEQLDEATGEEKFILVVWSYEDDPSSPWGEWLRKNVSRIAKELGVLRGIWITTPRAWTFDLLSFMA